MGENGDRLELDWEIDESKVVYRRKDGTRHNLNNIEDEDTIMGFFFINFEEWTDDEDPLTLPDQRFPD